jgi:nitrogen fixation-related uncharacterized protein
VPPATIRAAGALVGLQALVAVGFAVYALIRIRSGVLGVSAVLGEAGMYLLVGVALLAVALGLLRGRFWARTPAVVVQILLLPVAYTLLVSAHRLLIGAVVAVVAVGGLALLLCGPSRLWAEDLDNARRGQ